MADRIEQEFSIEAQRAIQELERLETGFENFQKRLRSTSRTIATYNRNAAAALTSTKNLADNVTGVARGFTALGKSGSALGQSVERTREWEQELRNVFRGTKDVEKGLKGSGRAAADLTISFETFSRIIATQFIVRALSDIRNRIRESVDQAIELQRQVALIGTIAGGASLQQIGDAVRDISDNFNLPLVETAVGLYNTLSNQVGDFGESLQFATEAAKFAKATNSTLADSVDLLSGALKAFGLTSADTGDLAGKFFVAIDRGRVTATEVANTLGRVLEPASAIGISFEELVGGIAEISVKGTSARESMTQFRGIINALTKPTKELTESLREMGFSTSEAAVQALGLPGLLDALVKSTDGSAEALAKLFPRVRGIGGVFSLTGENLEGFKRTVEEANNAGEEFANSKFLQATATDAEKVTKALTQLNNVFIEDVGNLIVRRGAQLVDFAGGLEGLEDKARIAVPAIESLTFTVGALIAVMAVGKVAAFFGAFTPVGAIVLGMTALATAIVAVAAALEDSRVSRIEDSIKVAGEAAEKELEEVQKRNKEELELERQKNKDILSAVRQRVADTNNALAPLTDNIRQTNERLVADVKAGLDEIIDARGQLLRELTSAVTESTDKIQESANLIRQIQARQEGREFETQQRGRSEEEQVFAAIARAADKARDAQNEFNKAVRSGSEESIKLARQSLERAQSEGESAKNRAVSLKDASLISRAEANLARQSQAQVDLENKLIRARNARIDALKTERSGVREVNSEIEKQAKIVRENTGLFDKQGQPFSDRELALREQRRGEALQQISGLAVEGLGDIERTGLVDLVRGVQDILTNNPADIVLNIAKVQEDLARQQFKVEAAVDLLFPDAQRLRELFPDITIKTADQVGDAAERFLKTREESLIKENQITEQTAKQSALRDRITQAISLLGDEQQKQLERAEKITRVDFLDEKEAIQETAGLVGELRQGLTDVLAGGDATEIVSKLQELNVQILKTEGDLSSVRDIFATIAPDVAELSKLKIEPITEEQAERARLLQQLNPFANAGDNLTRALSPAELIKQSALETEQAYKRAADALRGVPTGSPSANFAGLVGLSRFAGGGFAKGTDTVPAMLTPGESVINARATQRFFSQLQAINAGVTPVFRSDGGTVNNTGDINISISGAQSPTRIAEAVEQRIVRAGRLGKSKIPSKRGR